MPRQPLPDKTTKTDLICYWRDNPFANVSGLMRIGEMTFEQATEFINQNERKNPFGIAFLDALQERHGNGGSDESYNPNASELDNTNAAQLSEVCAGISGVDGDGISSNG